jgi:hypothetical protein
MMTLRKKTLVTALGLACTAGASQAALQAVDPGPYTAVTGYFPLYYTDTTNVTLDLCLSKAESSRVPGAPGAPSYMCTLLPNLGPPVIFDDALPIVFPFNFPDEAFWFTADAAIEEAQVNLTYGAALEAAFAGGVPVPGDQVSFARVRIRADITLDLQTPGTYEVTHPYGVETFEQVAPGRRVINLTRDIGIGGAGDFTGALAGDIGPFLQSVNGPYTETNPETGEPETFIGDPNLLEQVTGSPFGTNFVRIQRTDNTGLGIDYTTDVFAVSGRVWNGQRPTNVAVPRSTYSRSIDPGTGLVDTNVDVFASTPDSTTASVCFREDIDLVGGTDPCLIAMTGDGAGSFFGQDPAPLTVPPFVVVTATDPGVTTPTPLASEVTDVVTVARALYAKDTQTLIVDAASSDEVIRPTLAAVGFGRFTFVPGTVGSQRLQVNDVAEPPAKVTVFSSAGGRDVEPVVVVDAAPVNNAPVAVPDEATTAEDTAVIIDVLANDTDDDGDALAVTGVTGFVNGSASVNADGTVTFTPAPNFFGDASFSYNITDGNGGLASALVTVTVTPVNDPPRITSQPVTGATIGVAYSYDVNAVDPENDTLTYSLDAAPDGMGINASTGLITWTPTAAQAGANPVTVRVTDNGQTENPPGTLVDDFKSATQSFTITVGAGVDYDISRFTVPGTGRTGRPVSISLRFTNAGTVQQLRTATVTGTGAGVNYNQSLQISAAPGRTVTVSFPNVTPTTTGTIDWRVEIFDDNPDVDVATATTAVRR